MLLWNEMEKANATSPVGAASQWRPPTNLHWSEGVVPIQQMQTQTTFFHSFVLLRRQKRDLAYTRSQEYPPGFVKTLLSQLLA